MKLNSRPAWVRWTIAALMLCLTSVSAIAQGVTDAAQKKFEAITARFEQGQKDFEKKLETAKKDEAEELYKHRPGPEFIAEFKALAAENKGNEVAASCWMKVLSLSVDFGRRDDAIAAFDVLVTDHIRSPALVGLPGVISRYSSLFGNEKSEAVLRALIEKSPDKTVQAGAMYTFGSRILREKDPKPERIAEARTMFAKLATDYADVKSSRGKGYKELAEATLFELDHLQIGQVAPDFEVTDENGVKFKLSDYRGKVVVIDYWGNW